MARALAVGITCAPFISALLYAISRTGRAIHNHHTRSST